MGWLRRVCALVALLSCAAADEVDDIYDAIDAATVAASKGELGRARAIFGGIVGNAALLGQLPRQHQAQTLFNAGLSAQRLGDCGDAVRLYDRALALEPGLEEAYVKAAW
jgi:hypothetical protein